MPARSSCSALYAVSGASYALLFAVTCFALTGCVSGSRFRNKAWAGTQYAEPAQQITQAHIPPELDSSWNLGACRSELQNLSFKYERNEHGVVVGRGRVSVDDYVALADCLRTEGTASTFNQKQLLRSARRFYRRVLELDPNYVYAMHGIASIYLFLAHQTRGSFLQSLKHDYREHLVKAGVPLQEALRSDPNNAMTYYYMAQIKLLQDDWEGARQRFDEMIEKDRNIARRMSDFHAWNGYSQEMTDHYDLSLRAYEKSVEADETLTAADWAWDKIRTRSWLFLFRFYGHSLLDLRTGGRTTSVHSRNDYNLELGLGYFFSDVVALVPSVRFDLQFRDKTNNTGVRPEIEFRFGPDFRFLGAEPEGMHIRIPLFVRSEPAIGIAPSFSYAVRLSRYTEHSSLEIGLDIPVGVGFSNGTKPVIAVIFVLGWHSYY